jgi:hypothetical protein
MQQVLEEVLVLVFAHHGVGRDPRLTVEPAGAATRCGDLLESCKTKQNSLAGMGIFVNCNIVS